MDEFEQAILAQVDPTKITPDRLRAAQALTAQVRTAPDGWRFCLERLFNASNEQVKFFCFQVLNDVIRNRHNSLSATDQQLLRTSLMRWIKDYLPQHAQESSAIKNKFAQTIVLLFKLEYPTLWPTFFTELFSLLQTGPVVIELFLRIMKTIDEEVVSKEVPRSSLEQARNTAIKDKMREECLGTLVEVWYKLLVASRTALPLLAQMALATLRPYIGWIDKGLIVNDKFIPLFFECLQSEILRKEACECLCEVVAKGMDPLQKLDLIAKLNLLQIIANIQTDDQNYKVSVAKLLNTVGNGLVEGWIKLQELQSKGAVDLQTEAKGKQMVDAALPLLWKYMNDENDEVSAAVLGFVAAYLNKLKLSGGGEADEVAEKLKRFLAIIMNKMKFRDDFNFARHDDAEIQFLRYRADLENIFRSVMRVNSELVAAFVYSLLSKAMAEAATLPFHQVELSLALLKHMPEVKTVLSENIQRGLDEFFTKAVVALLMSNLFKHNHQAVVIATFEAISALNKYIPNDQAVIRLLLEAFLTVGLNHRDGKVRSRAAALFVHVVRTKKNELRPYTRQILVALQDKIVLNRQMQKLLKFEEQLYLFDAISALIGTGTDEEQISYFEVLLKPLVAQMNEIVTKGLYKTDTPENPTYTELIAQILTTMGCLGRGLPPCEKENKAIYWKEALEVAFRVLAALPEHQELRKKVIFFIHQMVQTLGVQISPFLPQIVEFLLANVQDMPQLMEFIGLINQFVSRFKEKFFPIMDKALLPMLAKIYGAMNVQTTPNSDEEREIQNFQRLYFTFIRRLITNHLEGVLISSTNGPQLGQILKTILAGTESPDLRMQQLCFGILERFIELWAGTGQGSVAGFNKVVYEQIMPAIFKAALKISFPVQEGVARSILEEMAETQKKTLAKCGPEYLQFLANSLLPSLGCDDNLRRAYIEHLEKAALPAWKEFFKNFIQAKKQTMEGSNSRS